MPGGGGLGNWLGESRPRLTKEQYQALGARLMKPRKKNADGTVETLQDIADEWNINISTLFRARNRFARTGKMEGKPGPAKGSGGAPRYMSQQQHDRIEELVEEHQTDPYDYTAMDLAHDLGPANGPRGPWERKCKLKDGTEEVRSHTEPSERSWSRGFERHGFKAYKPENREDYNEDERAFRVAFAQRYAHWTTEDWRRCFFEDEHGVVWAQGRLAERQARACKNFVRRRKGEGQKPGTTRSKKSGFTRGGTRINLYVCICNGKSILGEVAKLQRDKKFPAAAYIKVLEKIRVFAANAVGAVGFPRLYGLHDCAKQHTARITRAALNRLRLSTLYGYPSRSPDLNPIENLFPHIDRYLRNQQREHGDAATHAEFMQRVRGAFNQPHLQQLLLTLADSMPGRLQKCIEVQGRHTGK